MSTDLIPVADVERMARAIAASKLFGLSTPEQAMALMLVAQAEGRHPAIAARDYNVIQGRPALKADAMLARFQDSGGKVEWHAYTAEKAEATFSHPQGGSLRISWTMADARAAGLGVKGPWLTYPRAMLRARLISEAVRTIYPAVLCGFYSPEEVGDFEPKPVIRDMGRAEVIPDALPRPSTGADDATQGITLDDVRAAAKAAIGRVGRPVVMESLSSMGWERSEEIPAESRGDVIAVLKDLRAQEAA